MKHIAKLTAAALIAAIVLTLCACSSDITGRWRSTSEKQTQLAFSASGKVTMSADDIELSGTYTAEDGVLKMTLAAPDGELYVIEATYEVSDKKLYLTNSKGQIEVFER